MFKIKNGYKLELKAPETMKLFSNIILKQQVGLWFYSKDIGTDFGGYISHGKAFKSFSYMTKSIGSTAAVNGILGGFCPIKMYKYFLEIT